MNNLNIYETTIKLAGSFCDKYGRLKLSAVIEKMVDMAGEQTDLWEEKCEFPVTDTSWIINKYDIKVYRFPKKPEFVKLVTYQSRYTKHFCERIFAVYSMDDELLIRMVSFWSLRNFKEMKIVSVPEEYKQFTFTEGLNEKNDKKMSKNVEYVKTAPIYIRTDDFDTNMHVNNAKYFSFIYECDDVMDYDKYTLDEILLSFVGGINDKKGNEMAYVAEKTDGGMKLSQKVTCGDGSTACVMESYWREN